jgi:hypothetical protein
MSKELNNITLAQTDDVLALIEESFFDIPFDNSDFQTEAFVIGAQITPERAYRAIGLQIHSKLEAVKENLYQRELCEIEIEELSNVLYSSNSTKYEKLRASAKIKHLKSSQNWQNKLLNDALHEINLLLKHFHALPKFTRDQFEAAERLHFEQRLTRQLAGIQGAAESIVNMNNDIPGILKYEQELKALPAPTSEELLQLSLQSLTLIPPGDVKITIDKNEQA